jgi:uncharacterized protein (DUF924 family)
VSGTRPAGIEWGRYDPREDSHYGDRRRHIRRGRGRCLQRLRAPGDADRFRQHPHLQLADFTGILDFWFGAPDSPERGRPRKAWFSKSDAFDGEVRRRFLPLWESAARGGLERWSATPLASLALIVVLDQFPRNMFRGDPRTFATDPLARAVTAGGIIRGFDAQVPADMRAFFYLPFEHSEDLADQERGLALYKASGDADGLKWAEIHADIIRRFGRFPHRNAVLGRATTAEEQAFLDGGGFAG